MLKRLVRRGLNAVGLEVSRKRRPKPMEEFATIYFGRFGIKMSNKGQGHFPATYLNTPQFNSEIGRLIRAALPKYPDLAMVDVGANFGDTAAIAKTAADIPIFCIDGDPEAYTLLQENIRQFSQVTTCLSMLSDRTEEISVKFAKEGWNMTVEPSEDAGAVKVALRTLDAVLQENLPDLAPYRLLKVDVEGFDMKVLRGGMSYLADMRPMIIIEYNRENLDAIGEPALPTLFGLQDIGYDRLLVYDNYGRLLLATRLAEEQLLRDLHDYAPGKNSEIAYYDLCIFHADDDDIADSFTNSERARRSGASAD